MKKQFKICVAQFIMLGAGGSWLSIGPSNLFVPVLIYVVLAYGYLEKYLLIYDLLNTTRSLRWFKQTFSLQRRVCFTKSNLQLIHSRLRFDFIWIRLFHGEEWLDFASMFFKDKKDLVYIAYQCLMLSSWLAYLVIFFEIRIFPIIWQFG